MTATASPDLLAHSVILVTGAGSGIGAAVAKSYALSGATVILLDKTIAKLQQVYDDIVQSGGITPAIYPLDLKGATLADYEGLVESVCDNFKQLDGLVHCAATLGQIAPVEHQDPTTWLESLHINLTAAYLLTRSCLPLMRKSQHGAIIFTTDQHKNQAYWSAYGISKAAIEAFSQQLADELEDEGRVRVNCIDPGDVQTELFACAFPGRDPASIPKPEDITQHYLHLMAKESLNITGQVIVA